MRNKVVILISSLVLLASLTVVVSVFSQSAKKENKSVATPPACVCSDVSFLTISDDTFLKLGLKKDKIKRLKMDKGHLKGAIFNCKCGQTQCVATGITYKAQSNSISCIKGSLF